MLIVVVLEILEEIPCSIVVMNGVILAAVRIGEAHRVIDLVRQIHVVFTALSKADHIGRLRPIDLQIPHSIRHGAIHGALSTRDVGDALILIAPHNPLPLLREVEARDDTFALEYLQEGPDVWRIKFTRTAETATHVTLTCFSFAQVAEKYRIAAGQSR